MKKVLSLVLTLALVLSSFSFAFADDKTEAPKTEAPKTEAPKTEEAPAAKAGANLSDIAKSPNKEAIDVVNDLGIVTGMPDGTFLPEKDVTRAEFAAMLTRALAIPKSALEGYQKAQFKDMAGYEWANGYLAYCQSKGIMVGDGMGNAMPGRNVTLNEAMTMALRAVGYVDNSAHLKGNWPANFVTKAQELSLYEDVAKDSVVANRETAAQLIYNLLTVQKVAVATDGKTDYLWDKYDSKNPENSKPTNLLTAGLEADGYGTIITIDKLDNSNINLAKYLGQTGVLYRNQRSKKDVAFMSDKKYGFVMLVGRLNDDKDFVTSGDEETYTLKEPDYSKDAWTYPVHLVNGEDKKVSNKALKDLSKADGELAVFAEVSGKTIKEVAAINKWTVTTDKKVEASDLSDTKSKKLLGKKFPKDDSGNIDAKQFQLNGVAALEDIKADNVVYVYEANKKIVRVDVGTETVEGTVQRFKRGDAAKASAAVFKIGDKEFKNAMGIVNFADGKSTVETDHNAITAENVTDDVKVILDARGFVYEVTKSNKADKYALVIKEDNAMDHRAKLLFADGTDKVVDVKLDGKDKLGVLTENGDNGLVAYGLNKDGKVTDKDKDKTTKHYAKADVIFKSNAVVTLKGTDYNIVKDAPVFVYTDKDTSHNTADLKEITGGKTEYSVSTIDKVNKEQAKCKVKVLIKDKKVYALLVSDLDAKAGDKKYAVINGKTTINVNGNAAYEVKGFIDGVEVTKNTDDTYAAVKNASADYRADAKSSTVELYEVTVNKDDVITNVEKINDSNKDLMSGDINTKTKHSTVFALVSEQTDRRAIKVDGGRYLAVADKAVFYRLNSDGDYEVMTGAPKKFDYVKAYELNEEVGYDVVFVVSPAEIPTAVIVNTTKATAGNGFFTINSPKNKKFVVKADGKYYGVKADGTLADKKDSVSEAAGAGQAAEVTVPTVKVEEIGGEKLMNGKDYQVIEVKKAYLALDADANTIKGLATGNKYEKDTVIVNIVGAKISDASATANTDLLDNHADVGSTNINLKFEPVVAVDHSKITVKAENSTPLVLNATASKVTLTLPIAKVTAVDYNNEDEYYVKPADDMKVEFNVKVD